MEIELVVANERIAEIEIYETGGTWVKSEIALHAGGYSKTIGL